MQRKAGFRLALYVSFLLTTLFISSTAAAEENFRWRTGEELTYKVKWSFIRLGTVQLAVRDSFIYQGQPVHKVTFRIDSNPMLFFVNMHSRFTCYVDSLLRPVYYVAEERSGRMHKKAIYHFYYADSVFTIDFMDVKDTTKYRREVLPLQETVFDGISLIFHSRLQISKSHSDTVTAFIDDKLGKVQLNYHGTADTIHIASWDKAIPTYYVDGVIHMKGIAGVTGPFQGWFARDGQRPPLRAYVKVFIGNVIAELESWRNWQPPEDDRP